jgi:hypothetical protein
METSNMKQHLDNLLQEASEDDCTHDVVFQVTVFIKDAVFYVFVGF